MPPKGKGTAPTSPIIKDEKLAFSDTASLQDFLSTFNLNHVIDNPRVSSASLTSLNYKISCQLGPRYP